MLLYKSAVEGNKIILGDPTKGAPDISYICTPSFEWGCDYLPTGAKNFLKKTDKENLKTVAINFMASLRGVEIVRGYTNLEVFRNTYTISKNVIRIMGVFDTRKLSRAMPIMSLIVKNKEGKDIIAGSEHSMISFYVKNDDSISIETKPYDGVVTKPKNSKALGVMFYSDRYSSTYLVPAMRVLSTYPTKELTAKAMGTPLTPALAENIFLASSIENARTVIKTNSLKERYTVLITNDDIIKTREEVFGLE